MLGVLVAAETDHDRVWAGLFPASWRAGVGPSE